MSNFCLVWCVNIEIFLIFIILWCHNWRIFWIWSNIWLNPWKIVGDTSKNSWVTLKKRFLIQNQMNHILHKFVSPMWSLMVDTNFNYLPSVHPCLCPNDTTPATTFLPGDISTTSGPPSSTKFIYKLFLINFLSNSHLSHLKIF